MIIKASHSAIPTRPCVTTKVGINPKPEPNSVFQNIVGFTTGGLNFKY